MPRRTTAGNHGEIAKGRGATINIEGRFEKWNREQAEDGWFQAATEDEPSKPKTIVTEERVKSIITRNDSPDLGFDRSINPYRGCEHGCPYCASGDTLVLMANGRTRPLSEVRVGDEIYGWRRHGFDPRYARSRVLAHWSSIKPAYRTTLEDGTTLITSGDHRFLSDRGWKHVTGSENGATRRPHLTVNNKLMGTGAFAEGLVESDEYRRGYLGGLFRGDAHFGIARKETSKGTISESHRFRLALCDPEALLRAQDYLIDYEITTQERQFYAGTARHRASHSISAFSKSKVDAIRALIAWPTDPSRDWTAGFLAGIFDAEGSFSQTVWRLNN